MQNIHQTCRRCKKDFSIDENDQIFYQKMKVPNPTECPDCRFMCRAMWRNETTLYSRTCDLCQKNIISMYNPKSPYVVYCNDCYRSDTWDARDYAQDYDMSKSFFEQLDELLKKVPKNTLGISTGDGQNVNTEYANMISGCKNCYLVFNTSPAEDLLYSRGVRNGNFSSDIYFGVDFENCYQSINIFKSSYVYFGQNIQSCIDSYFILNCSNLINCFGCVNLRNKSNCWFNEQLTKDEYDSRLSKVLGSYSELEKYRKEFEHFALQFPQRESQNIKTVDSVGNYLTECKNVKQSFEVTKSEDCKYIFASKVIKDSLGTTGYGTNSEQLLEVVATGYSSNVIGTYWAENSQRIMYSYEPRNCQDSIGCDSLKNAQYCILNKQYTKEEYETLRAHIVDELSRDGDYGLMLPPELSPFGYNETIGNDNMKLTKERAIELGFKWQEDIQKTVGKETIQPENLEDTINDVLDTITDEILRCIDCSRNYKITEQELFFYKKVKLPIPRKCFFCRHHDRIEKRGPYKFWKRNCALCNKDIETNFSPDRPEIIYCEECYRREVL
jgi:hypothetical protein